MRTKILEHRFQSKYCSLKSDQLPLPKIIMFSFAVLWLPSVSFLCDGGVWQNIRWSASCSQLWALSTLSSKHLCYILLSLVLGSSQWTTFLVKEESVLLVVGTLSVLQNKFCFFFSLTLCLELTVLGKIESFICWNYCKTAQSWHIYTVCNYTCVQ